MGACITDECTVAVAAERLWKAANDLPALPKMCPGFIDAIEVEGDSGAGSITTMKVNPAVEAGAVFKNRVLVHDDAAMVKKTEVVEAGGKVSSLLKSQVVESKLEAAGAGCVAKLKVEYETLDGGALSPEDEKMVLQGYFSLLKMIEAYLVAHPAEYV